MIPCTTGKMTLFTAIVEQDFKKVYFCWPMDMIQYRFLFLFGQIRTSEIAFIEEGQTYLVWYCLLLWLGGRISHPHAHTHAQTHTHTQGRIYGLSAFLLWNISLFNLHGKHIYYSYMKTEGGMLLKNMFYSILNIFLNNIVIF